MENVQLTVRKLQLITCGNIDVTYYKIHITNMIKIDIHKKMMYGEVLFVYTFKRKISNLALH
jgi:hypothetical protein